MNQSEKKRKIILFSAIYFSIGCIIGIVLFYGQMNLPDSVLTELKFETNVEVIDFFRLSWLNALWLFSICLSQGIAPYISAQPIMLARGCATTFSASYILKICGIKSAVCVVLPQCFSILPAMLLFLIQRQSKRDPTEKGELISRYDAVMILFFSIISALAEGVSFVLLCKCLF